MINKQDEGVLIVKRSCLTRRIVWVCRGASEEAARKAYWRACKMEVRYIRNWTKSMIRRRRLLMNIVTHGDDGAASNPALKSSRKRELTRRLIQLAKEEPVPDREFYDHIIEEAKRRNLASDRWKINRTKMTKYGQTYVESEYQKGKK